MATYTTPGYLITEDSDEVPTEEQLIVIPTGLLNRFGTFQGMVPYDSKYNALLKIENQIILPRSKAEHDPTYKQLVVYVTVIDDDGNILTYLRHSKKGDSRLSNKLSIGFGGHVNARDGSPIKAVVRELEEEINLINFQLLSQEGFINDDSDAVGKVHLGLIYTVRILQFAPMIVAADDNISELAWLNAHEIRLRADELESWSGHVLKNLTKYSER